MTLVQMLFSIVFSKNPFSFGTHLTLNHKNLSPRTGPQDLLVKHYDLEDHQKKRYINMELTINHCANLNHKIFNQKLLTLYLTSKPEPQH